MKTKRQRKMRPKRENRRNYRRWKKSKWKLCTCRSTRTSNHPTNSHKTHALSANFLTMKKGWTTCAMSNPATSWRGQCWGLSKATCSSQRADIWFMSPVSFETSMAIVCLLLVIAVFCVEDLPTWEYPWVQKAWMKRAAWTFLGRLWPFYHLKKIGVSGDKASYQKEDYSMVLGWKAFITRYSKPYLWRYILFIKLTPTFSTTISSPFFQHSWIFWWWKASCHKWGAFQPELKLLLWRK